MRTDASYYLAEVEIDQGNGQRIGVVRRFSSSGAAVKWITERRTRPDATGEVRLDFVHGPTKKTRSCDHLINV